MPDDPLVAVLDGDRADLARHPTRTRVGAPIGVPWEVETPGDNRTPARFGALNSRTGQAHFALRPPKRRGDVQACVDQGVRPASPPADFRFLIVDGATSYQSKSTPARLAQRPASVLVPLPSSAPKLNLRALIRRGLRADVTHTHVFGSCNALIAAAQRFFERLAQQPPAVLRRSGRDFHSVLDHHLAAVA